MREVKMLTVPKCNGRLAGIECDKDAVYDAPTGSNGAWGYWCEDCAKKLGAHIAIGSKLVQHTPAQPKGGKAKLATELSDMEAIVMDGEREVECPDCGCIRRVEPDADYKFDCEDCGVRLRCASIM